MSILPKSGSSGDAPVGHPAEVLRVQEVRRRRQRERERGHGEVEATSSQRGEPDCGGDGTAHHEADDQGEAQVEAPVDGRLRADCRPDREERDLPERHLARPPGEHHDRQPEHRVDADRRELVGAVDREHLRHDQHRGRDDRERPPLHGAHDRDAAHLVGDRTHVVGAPPRRHVGLVDARRAAPREHQRDDDDGREDRVDEQRARGREPDGDLEDAERDRVGADREQVRHPAEHERGERAEQDTRR